MNRTPAEVPPPLPGAPLPPPLPGAPLPPPPSTTGRARGSAPAAAALRDSRVPRKNPRHVARPAARRRVNRSALPSLVPRSALRCRPGPAPRYRGLRPAALPQLAVPAPGKPPRATTSDAPSEDTRGRLACARRSRSAHKPRPRLRPRHGLPRSPFIRLRPPAAYNCTSTFPVRPPFGHPPRSHTTHATHLPTSALGVRHAQRRGRRGPGPRQGRCGPRLPVVCSARPAASARRSHTPQPRLRHPARHAGRAARPRLALRMRGTARPEPLDRPRAAIVPLRVSRSSGPPLKVEETHWSEPLAARLMDFPRHPQKPKP